MPAQSRVPRIVGELSLLLVWVRRPGADLKGGYDCQLYLSSGGQSARPTHGALRESEGQRKHRKADRFDVTVCSPGPPPSTVDRTVVRSGVFRVAVSTEDLPEFGTVRPHILDLE